MATPMETTPTETTESICMVLRLYKTVVDHIHPSYDTTSPEDVLEYFTKHLDKANYTIFLERSCAQVVIKCTVGFVDEIAKLITRFNYYSWNHDRENILIGGTDGNPMNWV